MGSWVMGNEENDTPSHICGTGAALHSGLHWQKRESSAAARRSLHRPCRHRRRSMPVPVGVPGTPARRTRCPPRVYRLCLSHCSRRLSHLLHKDLLPLADESRRTWRSERSKLQSSSLTSYLDFKNFSEQIGACCVLP
jgi:hypothetical protein